MASLIRISFSSYSQKREIRFGGPPEVIRGHPRSFLNSLQQNLDFVLLQIKSLKEDYRTILKLRYFDDLSLKQIEDFLNEEREI